MLCRAPHRRIPSRVRAHSMKASSEAATRAYASDRLCTHLVVRSADSMRRRAVSSSENQPFVSASSSAAAWSARELHRASRVAAAVARRQMK
jgi:hypothetical protein